MKMSKMLGMGTLSFLVVGICYGFAQNTTSKHQSVVKNHNDKKQCMKEEEPAKIKTLIEMLRNRKADIRNRAIKDLASISDERVVDALIELLNDKDPYVLQSTIFLLGMRKDQKAVEPLSKMVRHSNILIRRESVRALRKIGSKEVVPALISAMKDKDVRTRREAVQAFVDIVDKRAASCLLERLNDEDKVVRFFSLRAIEKLYAAGVLDNEQVVPSLVKALHDAYWENRLLAVRILGEVGDKRAIAPVLVGFEKECENIDLLRKEPRECNFSPSVEERLLWEYVDALKSWGRSAVSSVRNALREGERRNREFRYCLAIVLAAMGDKSVSHVLMDALRHSELVFVRSNAARYLGEFGCKEAVPVLKEALQDKSRTGKGLYLVRMSAAKALERLGVRVK